MHLFDRREQLLSAAKIQEKSVLMIPMSDCGSQDLMEGYRRKAW